jgi:hypothetical protein
MRTLHELERRCQKPDWQTVGSWLARYWARPAALRVTRIALHWPLSPHWVTVMALLVALAGAAALGSGSPAGLVAGVLLLHFWYLLDHVDGQLARYHGRSSVTGIFFDFWMHHVVLLAVSLGLGFGLAVASGSLVWAAVGCGLALGLEARSLCDDCQHKAFFCALSRDGGSFVAASGVQRPGLAARGTEPAVHRGAPHQPESQSPDSLLVRGRETLRNAFHRTRWLSQKLCEMPNLLAALTLLALVVVVDAQVGHRMLRAWMATMAGMSVLLAVGRVTRLVRGGVPDVEYRLGRTTEP